MARIPQQLDKKMADLFSGSPPASFGSRAGEFIDWQPPQVRRGGGQREVVLVAACRTPFGRVGGILKDYSAVELGALAIKELLDRVSPRLKPQDVDYVLTGQVVTAGGGQITGRQAAILAGLPPNVPGITLNKVCASGLKAVDLASQMIQLGRAEICIAAGQESMSNCPYALPEMRFGVRMGLPHRKVDDLMVKDGLWCPFHDRHMALHGSEVADEFGFTREEQDNWAWRSQQRACEAMNKGLLTAELFPIACGSGKKFSLLDQDEALRPETTREGLAKLPPVFGHLSPVTGKPGSVTAGNAPGVNDGAGACLLVSREKARKLGLDPLCHILDYAEVSCQPKDIAVAPGLAIRKLLAQNDLTLADVDLLEINEAFAAVALVSGQAILGLTEDEMERKVNVNGGAIAYGHPIGATGTRILMTLAYELKRRGGGLGIAGICSGAAQGDAILIKA